MQSQTSRRVIFPNSFANFEDNCRNAFHSELAKHGTKFKIYRMPYGITSISERVRIDEENYSQLCEDMRNVAYLIPVILLWSYSKDKNGNSPNDRNYEDFQDVKSPGTRSSTSVSGTIKSTYKYICLACKHNFQNARSSINGCHILELEELQGLSAEEIDQLTEKCDLDEIDDPRNYIPLCTTCHNNFDYQRLGIELQNNKYLWQMKPELEQTAMPHSNNLYGILRGTEIPILRRYHPPPALLAHRQVRYIANISSRTKKRKVILSTISVFVAIDFIFM